MALKAYEDLAAEPLQFPIGNKVYTVPDLPISAGLKLSGVFTGADEEFSQAAGTDLWKLLLGPVWDEMIADDVPTAAITRAGLTALADYRYGRATAEIAWETGTDPKAIQKYLEARQPTASSKRAAASTTKRPASGNGTKTSRRK